MPYRKRLSALLSKGYFPKELPPVFSTADFGKHAAEILSDWEKDKVFKKTPPGKIQGTKKYRSGSYSYNLDNAEVEVISKPKRGYERRNIHITHPIPQALLSYEIAENYNSIQKWLLRQSFSLDQIRISESFDRSIKGINFDIHRAKKAFIEATSDWLVKTDISRFYPSIYTHSIAWAAYGKERVKSDLKLYNGSLADRLDTLVRSCNRNQTVGIPIGPETSRILAEVISSRIDADLQARLPEAKNKFIDRLQDDWFVGIATLEEAEKVLSAITRVYRDYGLEINGSKTSVDRVIGSPGTRWISEIGGFLSHRPGSIHGSRLRELLSLSFNLQSIFPNEPVLNYVLTIIESHAISSTDVEALESFLLKSAIVSPISMDRICRVILNIQHRTKKISKQRICDRFTTLAERNLEKGNLFEVIWLLYTIRGLQTPLRSKSIAKLIETVPSSALCLILLDMESKGLHPGKLPKNRWAGQITKDQIRSDWTWLLAYEGIRHGWLPDPSNVMSSPFFQAMASRNVEFYDPKRNVPFSSKIMQANREARRRNRFAVLKFIQSLRGFDLGSY